MKIRPVKAIDYKFLNNPKEENNITFKKRYITKPEEDSFETCLKKAEEDGRKE